MALRWAVNRAKLWSRFVNPTFGFGRRYYLYYLPPPPPYDPKIFGGRYTWPVPDISDEFQRAISAAKFAVMMHNEVKDRNIKFARLVRASEATPAGSRYYLTIEGIDEDGDLNVYFALVTNDASECQQSLIDWRRVDTDFEYPFSHTMKYEIPAYRVSRKRPDYFRMMSKFEQHVGRFHSDLSDAVEICNIMDLGEALHYALYAAKPLEWVKKEPLRKLLYASRVDIGGMIFYHLLVDAFRENTHELKLNYALVRIYKHEKKLIQWKEVDNWPNNPSVFQVAQGA